MGYRLEIYSGVFTGFTGGKLYGYVDDNVLQKLKSYQYLINIGKLDKEFDTKFGYGFNRKILLKHDQFKKFIELYKQDINDYGSPNAIKCFNEQYNFQGFKELLDSISDKIISWEG